MRSIWLRITLGALAVFAVGTTVVHFGRKAKSTVQRTLQSDAPLPIPLAGLVPFRIDNRQLGSLRKLEFLRSSPSEISGMRIVVDVANDSAGHTLMNCRVGLRDIDNIDEHTTFVCLSADSMGEAGLESFGFVYLGAGGDSVPLFLPHEAVTELRGVRLNFNRHGLHIGHAGDSIRVDVQADSIRRIVAQELERAAVELERARADVKAPVPPEPPASPAAPVKP